VHRLAIHAASLSTVSFDRLHRAPVKIKLAAALAREPCPLFYLSVWDNPWQNRKSLTAQSSENGRTQAKWIKSQD
jgi:hypothetical protein